MSRISTPWEFAYLLLSKNEVPLSLNFEVDDHGKGVYDRRFNTIKKFIPAFTKQNIFVPLMYSIIPLA